MNPWKAKIHDCAIRAVSLGLAMRYPSVCRMFGRRCRAGVGLEGEEGIDLEDVKRRFAPYFDEIRDAKFSEEYPLDDPYELPPEIAPDADTIGFTLDEFCEFHHVPGRYLVALNTPRDEKLLSKKDSKHMVYCDLRPGRRYFVDTWDCGWMNVECYLRIRRIWPTDRPESLVYGRKVVP